MTKEEKNDLQDKLRQKYCQVFLQTLSSSSITEEEFHRRWLLHKGAYKWFPMHLAERSWDKLKFALYVEGSLRKQLYFKLCSLLDLPSTDVTL